MLGWRFGSLRGPGAVQFHEFQGSVDSEEEALYYRLNLLVT